MTAKALTVQPNGIPHIEAKEDLGDVSLMRFGCDGSHLDEFFLDHDAAVALRDWLNEVIQ